MHANQGYNDSREKIEPILMGSKNLGAADDARTAPTILLGARSVAPTGPFVVLS